MSRFTNPAKIQLPKSWSTCVRSALLHVVSLAQYAAVYTRSWAADSPNARVRLKAAKDYAEQDAALLREEMRIKDARMATIAPQRRPYYPPAERMAILELRAARGWSLSQTAEVFLVTATTISTWMKRVDEIRTRCAGEAPHAGQQVSGLRAVRRTAAPGAVPHTREEEDRGDSGPRRSASGNHNDWPHAPGKADCAAVSAFPEIQTFRQNGDGQAPQSRLVRVPCCRSRCHRIMA